MTTSTLGAHQHHHAGQMVRTSLDYTMTASTPPPPAINPLAIYQVGAWTTTAACLYRRRSRMKSNSARGLHDI
jgi:hypothetical protein